MRVGAGLYGWPGFFLARQTDACRTRRGPAACFSFQPRASRGGAKRLGRAPARGGFVSERTATAGGSVNPELAACWRCIWERWRGARPSCAYVSAKPTLSALEMFGVVWLFVPLLAGSQSVADERQLGTLDGILCLPVSRRAQFGVKLLFVLVLGGLLSAALLCALEEAGRWASGRTWT